MAIPFYENDEKNQQQQHPIIHHIEEVDQVDGPAYSNNQNVNSHFTEQENHHLNPSANDLQAWKILALVMCKVLKDFYQQNLSQTSSQSSSSTAYIQILPNGQVKPKWN